jgi:hypothetical protein
MKSRFVLFSLIPLAGGCAPTGYHYDHYDVGSFTLTPNDPCQRTNVTQGAVNILNQKIGKTSGPPAQVVSATGLTGEWNAGVLNCRGTLQTVAGPNGPGVVQVHGDIAPGNYGINVREANWETDTERDRKEALARQEQARWIAEAPAREAKFLDDTRKSAEAEPNKTVQCSPPGMERWEVWTTNAICYAITDEGLSLSHKIGTGTELRANLWTAVRMI